MLYFIWFLIKSLIFAELTKPKKPTWHLPVTYVSSQFLLNSLQKLEGKMWLFEIKVISETFANFKLKIMLNMCCGFFPNIKPNYAVRKVAENMVNNEFWLKYRRRVACHIVHEEIFKFPEPFA